MPKATQEHTTPPLPLSPSEKRTATRRANKAKREGIAAARAAANPYAELSNARVDFEEAMAKAEERLEGACFAPAIDALIRLFRATHQIEGRPVDDGPSRQKLRAELVVDLAAYREARP